MASFLKHECESGFGSRQLKWVSSGGTEGQSLFLYIGSSPQGSAVIRVFR